MERPILIDEQDCTSKMDFKNGYWIKFIHTLRIVRDMSLVRPLLGIDETKVIATRFESNLPKADHSAFLFYIRENYDYPPNRILRYFKE